MRIALAQINPTLADFGSNSKKILSYCDRAIQQEADVVVFPEAALFGYHPFDLLERKELVDKQLQTLKQIEKKVPKNLLVVLGCFTKNKSKKGRPYYNSAAVIQKGKVTRFFHKQLLPTGDVFDEARFIEPGDTAKNFFSYKGKKFLLTICEDIWAWPEKNGHSHYRNNPLSGLTAKAVDVVLNLSASPYTPKKWSRRLELVQATARAFDADMIYVNLVGAQDEIIFDGASFVCSRSGRVSTRAAAFTEDLLTYELQRRPQKAPANLTLPATDPSANLYKALVLGIRDFCEKNGFKKVHLGLSGGIDSAVVAVLAAEAVGPRNVQSLALPGPFSSPLSFDLAQKLSENLQINHAAMDINKTYKEMLRALSSVVDTESFGLLHENLQARIRGTLLMAYGNRNNSLLLSTSNKTEAATGYTTLYGDMCGGLAPIADLTKKQVYEIAEFCNREREIIPKAIITRPPTAELRKNQKDQDSLPEYNLLDQSVDKIVTEANAAKTEIDKWLLQKIYQTEFKRWQSPPILKISEHSFGRGRRWPISKKIAE